MTKDDKIFNGLEEVIQTRINTILLLRKKPIPADCVEKHVATIKFHKDEKHLGFSLRHGMVTGVTFDSPFKGALGVGDILVVINGTLMYFEEKDKDKPGNANAKEYNTFITNLMAKTAPKVEIGFLRLKQRIANVQPPKGATVPEGHQIETAMLYQYKYLKLGLNIQQVGETVVVYYTSPGSTSHISLNIGETILAIDDVLMSSLEQVRTKILDSCNKNGLARLCVSYPTSDMLKNAVRNQLAGSIKFEPRPQFQIPDDVRKFSENGINVVKTAAEPEPIYGVDRKPEKTAAPPKNEKTEAAKSNYEKGAPKPGLFNVRKILSFHKKEKGFGFRDTVGEHDIPSEWNSKLFVVLPPLKTVETEKTGAQQNSVYKKT